MPRGDKDKYTEKQKRKAGHIEENYENKGVSKGEAESRAWATVNKQSGGGKRQGGSGEKTSDVAKAQSRKSSARRAVATRKGRSSISHRLEDMSKAELVERARQLQIARRSTMRKGELIEALRQAN